MAKLLSSPLVSASNNIVLFAKGTKTLPKVQKELVQFNQFLQFKTVELEKLKLPEKKKIKELANLNIASSFGAPGGLLRSLASGALDVAGFLGNMFPSKGKTGKPGRLPKKIKVPKPVVRGSKLKLGGIRAVGVVNALFAGLDFATGLQEGESVGKAAAGAGGSLAGSLLGGVIGQTLIPIPGVGFVLGSMAGGFLGGYAADRVYEGGSSIKKKLDERLKKQEAKQKGAASGSSNFGDMVSKFSSAVSKFEQGVSSGLFGGTIRDNYNGTQDGKSDNIPMEKDTPELVNNNQQTGETGDYSVSGGSTPSSKRGSPYGSRNGKTHYGIDYPVNVGTKISVIQPGTVGFSGVDSGGNLSVYVDHTDGSHTRYLHLSKTNVSQGQKIEPGTLIGETGGAKGAYGSGNSTGPHLHYEYAAKGGGSIDPARGNNDDKYFRFGGNVTVKPKVNAQSGMMGQSGAPTVILAAGTNDYADPKSGADGITKSIKELQAKGYNVVVVPPNESGKFAGVSKSVQEAATASGATIEKGKYDQNDPLHLQMSEASRIREKYGKNAKIIGDSNAVRIAGGSMQDVPGQRVVGAGTKEISKFAQNMGRVAPTVTPTVAPPQRSIQQYPTYNQQQSSVTVMPILMGGGQGGGGGQQQKPVYIPVGGGGGGGTVILPGPSEGQVVNSLVKTLLLTTLSGS